MNFSQRLKRCEIQFDFGQNWVEFSQKALTTQRVEQAKRDFASLLDYVDLQGKSFLDIGFGQGLSLLAASEMGARVFGNDIDQKCVEAMKHNASYFRGVNITDIPIFIGSILDENVVSELMNKSTKGDGFDIVHSWGVLHHAGDMKNAMMNAAYLVRPEGYLILALYNRHWTSPMWKRIKWFYCKSPVMFQKLMIGLFYQLIWIAKFCVTGENPKKQTRGMDFYYNVIDWVGGYPYEYASIEEVDSFFSSMGFRLVKMIHAQVPTGCNEFVFVRNK